MHNRIEDDLLLWGFDAMALNGTDLRIVALEDRKRHGGHLISAHALRRPTYSETFEDGERLAGRVWRALLEGVVAKHKNGVYRSGRSTSWIRVKCPAWREANRDRVERFDERR